MRQICYCHYRSAKSVWPNYNSRIVLGTYLQLLKFQVELYRLQALSVYKIGKSIRNQVFHQQRSHHFCPIDYQIENATILFLLSLSVVREVCFCLANLCSFQCDQIWRNFANGQYSASLWAISKSLNYYLAKFYTIFGNFLCFWANLHWYKWPNIEKQSSHLVTLVRSIDY